MRFMIQITMKQGIAREEMLARLPAQEDLDTAHIKQGIQEIPALVAADRSIGWKVMNCGSRDHLQKTLEASPLYDMTEYVITPLLATEDNAPK